MNHHDDKLKKQQILASIYGLKPKQEIKTESKIETKKKSKFSTDAELQARVYIEKPIVKETQHELWVDKYKPTCFNQMVGLRKDVGIQMDVFLDSRKQRPYSSMQMLLLSGPNGVGKTVLAELMLKKKGFSNILHVNPGSSATVKNSAAIKEQDSEDDEQDEVQEEILNDQALEELKEGKKDKTGINVETVYSMVERLSRENYKDTAIIIDDIDALGGNFSLGKFSKLLTLHKETVHKKIAKFTEQRNEEIKKKLGQEKKKPKGRQPRKIDQTKIFGLPPRFSVPLCTIVATTSLLFPFSDKKKMGALKTNCMHVSMDKLSDGFLNKLAKRIMDAEKMTLTPKETKTVIESAQGDARRLVNLLQYYNIQSNTTVSEKKNIQLIEDSEADIFQQDLFETAKEMFQNCRTIDMDASDEYLNFDSVLLPAMVRENYLSHICKYMDHKQRSSFETMETIADIADAISEGDALCPSKTNADHPENTFGTESEQMGKLLTLATVLPKLPPYLPSKGHLYLKFPRNELCWYSSVKSKKRRWDALYETMNLYAHRPFEMRPSEFPRDAFQCGNKKWIYLDCGSERWDLLMSALGLESWSNENKFEDEKIRFAHCENVLEKLAKTISEHSFYELKLLFPNKCDKKEWIEPHQTSRSCAGFAFIGTTLDKIEHAQALVRYCWTMEKWLAKNNPKHIKKLSKEQTDSEPPRKKRKLEKGQVITEHQQFASHHDPIGIAVPRLCAEYGLLTFEDIAEIADLVSPLEINIDSSVVRQAKFDDRTATYLPLFGKKSLGMLLALA